MRVFILLFLSTACLAQAPVGTWYFNTINYTSKEIRANGTVTFTKDGISTNAGCNTINVPIKFLENGKVLKTGISMSTRKACEKKLMLVDNNLTACINQITKYEASKNKIMFYMDSINCLTLYKTITLLPKLKPLPIVKTKPQMAVEDGRIVANIKGANWSLILRQNQRGDYESKMSSGGIVFNCKKLIRFSDAAYDMFMGTYYNSIDSRLSALNLKIFKSPCADDKKSFMAELVGPNDLKYEGCALDVQY